MDSYAYIHVHGKRKYLTFVHMSACQVVILHCQTELQRFPDSMVMTYIQAHPGSNCAAECLHYSHTIHIAKKCMNHAENILYGH